MSATRAALVAALRARVEDMRPLPEEVAHLDATQFVNLDSMDWHLIAGELRLRKGRKLAGLAAEVSKLREPALIASMGAGTTPVQPWEGVIGAEGRLTGDNRLIDADALSWATFPLPLRYAPADYGGHDGAMLVGRIDAIERGDDGLIRARGVLDLGSPLGREATRLIRGGFLSGVSMDLDTVNAATGSATLVTTEGRVRAATLVAIPAFDEARIALTDTGDADALADLELPDDPDLATEPHTEDCGCSQQLTVIYADDLTAPSRKTQP
jgi:hypothetical protein